MKTTVERAKPLRSVNTLAPGLSTRARAHILVGVEASGGRALPATPRCIPLLQGKGSAACAGSCLLPCTRPWHPMVWPVACTSLLPITRAPCESKKNGPPSPSPELGAPCSPASS